MCLKKNFFKRSALWTIEHAPGGFASRLKNPVFILGYGRSGKSLFSKALSRHAQICLYPSEANHLWHPELYPWAESKHREEVRPVWWDAKKYAEASLRLREPDWVKKLRKAFGAWQAIKRGKVILNDSAMTVFLIDEIQKEFEGAKFIHVVRDGRVAAWIYAQRQYQKNLKVAKRFPDACVTAAFPEVLKRCAQFWHAQVVEIEEKKHHGVLVPGQNLIELRYEDLCEKPEDTLEEVLEFLGLEKMARCGLEHLKNQNASVLREVEAPVLAEMTDSLRDALEIHGYLQG